MSKKSRLRGPLDRQHGKWAETLFQSQRQHILIYLLITVKVIELKKVSLCDMQNLKTAC